MRVGIDLDGCVYDFVSDYRSWVHAATGKSYDDMPDAEGWNFFKDQWGMTTPEYLDLLDRGVSAGYVFAQGRSIRGAIEGLCSLLDQGHEVNIVTNRPQPGAIANTRYWLHEHGVPYTSLTFDADKTCVPSDIFLEDNVDNYETLCAAGVDGVLYTQKWNECLIDANRVHSWPEFVSYVGEHQVIPARLAA